MPRSGRITGFAHRFRGCALPPSTVLAAAAAHAEPCSITRYPNIPVTMKDLQPMVRAQINGQDAWLVVDSGAFFSILTPSAVAQLKLPYKEFPGLFVEGVGGHESARVARVRKFTLIGKTWDDVEFVVAGSSFGAEVDGLLGQNVLEIA